MSFLTLGLTTKALIRALQWRRMEAEEKAMAAQSRKQVTRKNDVK